MMKSVNDRARTEEEQCLEEAMRDQVHDPDRAAENQQRDKGGADANGEKSRVFEATASLVVKQKSAAALIKPKHPEKKTKVADAGGDESFPGRGGSARPLDPKSNEQIGRES